MTTIPLTEAKKKLLELVRDVEKQGKIYSLTRHGKPAAVIMSEEEYQSIKETLDVMTDPEEVRGILEGLREIEAGEVEDLEDLLERLQG